MYLDAMEFLEEEHDAWAPYEALTGLTDEQLRDPVEGSHGWSGRDLMAHMVAWQGVALDAARELAIRETSEVFARMDADWEARGGDAVNEEITQAWANKPMEELRDLFVKQPGELRGFLTVVPEVRWLKNAEHLKSFYDETIDHYADHTADLEAILEAASSAAAT
jgi:hypothetical protein